MEGVSREVAGADVTKCEIFLFSIDVFLSNMNKQAQEINIMILKVLPSVSRYFLASVALWLQSAIPV